MATQDEDDEGDDYNSLHIWNTTHNNNTTNTHSNRGGNTTVFITRTLLIAKHTNSNITNSSQNDNNNKHNYNMNNANNKHVQE